MQSPNHRREFLKAAGLAALAGAEFLQPGDSGAAHAAPAPSKQAFPRLLVGCCAYSFRKYLDDGRMSMEDFIRKAVRAGALCDGAPDAGKISVKAAIETDLELYSGFFYRSQSAVNLSKGACDRLLAEDVFA